MAAKKAAAKTARKSPARSAPAKKSAGGFTAEERAAMRERAREIKAEQAGGDEEATVVAKIARMAAPDRALGERLHALIRKAAPQLTPRLWYGMPAYAKDGKVLCFFQDAAKFKSRYATLGFSDKAQLDEGDLWPTTFALVKLTPAVEARIVELLKRAVG